MSEYAQRVLRNNGYIAEPVQSELRALRVLVAGCGIGSGFAEVLVRLGCEHVVLLDGDHVARHNLNRQNFTDGDVGSPKAAALAARLLAINPDVQVKVLPHNLTPANADALVAEVDFVFDTIDFLDLQAIVALHDAAHRQGRPIITALAIGWGAGCVYFPAQSTWTFRALFDLPPAGPVANASYVERFAKVLERLAQQLDPLIIQVVGQALTVMEDGRPCPAAQVAPGAACVAALAATLLVRVLAGEPVRAAPHMNVVDLGAALNGTGIDLS